MSTKIRLQRVGKRGQAIFRLVVTDSRNSAKGGRVIEIIGHYDPKKPASKVELNKEKALYWLKQGAIASFKVQKFLGDLGVVPKIDVSKLKKKAPKTNSEEKTEAAPAEAAK